jgi:hypothetical protein
MYNESRWSRSGPDPEAWQINCVWQQLETNASATPAWLQLMLPCCSSQETHLWSLTNFLTLSACRHVISHNRTDKWTANLFRAEDCVEKWNATASKRHILYRINSNIDTNKLKTIQPIHRPTTKVHPQNDYQWRTQGISVFSINACSQESPSQRGCLGGAKSELHIHRKVA